MRTAGHSSKTAAAVIHMLLKDLLFWFSSLCVQGFQQGDPCMAVWLLEDLAFSASLFKLRVAVSKLLTIDQDIVFGQLRSHQASTPKFRNIHGILQDEFCEDLDALHEKLLAACRLVLGGFSIICPCARPRHQRHLDKNGLSTLALQASAKTTCEAT